MRRILPFLFALLVILPNATPVAATSTAVRHVILTSRWSTPSPDPTGLDLMAGQLLVSDSEVDETGLYKGKNVWRTSRRGAVQRTMTTKAFSTEPTDIASDLTRNVFFFSDDVKDRIFIVWRGPDHVYGTSDDRRRSIDTTAFDVPSLGVEALASGGGNLWLGDGTSGLLYRIEPGPNGRYEGAGSDDVISHWDLNPLGIRNIEGVEFADNRLFVVANEKNADILELDPANPTTLIRAFDLSTANIRHPSALAYGASSLDPSKKSFYVADRGTDNNVRPSENDGRIVELGAVATPPNLIKNGGFEQDANGNHIPDFWIKDRANAQFTRTSFAKHDGTYSGRHLGTNNLTYSVRQDLNDVVAGETYHFSGWTRIPATTDTFTYRIRIVWFGSTGAKIGTTGLAVFTAPAGWTLSERNVTAPGGTVRGRIVMSVTSLNGTIYADTFSLTVVS
ncbi:MAG TPA: hypothetical protein VFH98_08285 [Candidatus Limnocylindria bacterium]|jgi:hypothetical protein|nr:hypothetical protein [Candidatus Limnocylindria bacterium]